MRLRMLGAAFAAVLAAGSLTACRSNVGLAASVDGHRFSESDVSSYLTPQAQSVRESGANASSTVQVPARSFVVETLIVDRLLKQVTDALPHPPTAGDLASIRDRGLAGSSPTTFAERAGLHGFTASFDSLWIDTKVLQSALSDAQQADSSIDVAAIAGKLHFPVQVNPRYGSWDAKTFSFSADSNATRPAFLKIKSTDAGYAPLGDGPTPAK